MIGVDVNYLFFRFRCCCLIMINQCFFTMTSLLILKFLNNFHHFPHHVTNSKWMEKNSQSSLLLLSLFSGCNPFIIQSQVINQSINQFHVSSFSSLEWKEIFNSLMIIIPIQRLFRLSLDQIENHHHYPSSLFKSIVDVLGTKTTKNFENPFPIRHLWIFPFLLEFCLNFKKKFSGLSFSTISMIIDDDDHMIAEKGIVIISNDNDEKMFSLQGKIASQMMRMTPMMKIGHQKLFNRLYHHHHHRQHSHTVAVWIWWNLIFHLKFFF